MPRVDSVHAHRGTLRSWDDNALADQFAAALAEIDRLPVEDEQLRELLGLDVERPGLAEELRARFPSVAPGYHTNKRHWNTVVLDGSIDDEEMCEMVDHSYDLVVTKLPRAERSRLGL